MTKRNRGLRQAKDKFKEISYRHTTDNTNLQRNVSELGNRVYEELQIWIDNHIRYMKTQLENLEPLCAKQDAALTLIESLWDEVNKTNDELAHAVSVDQAKDGELPFDPTLLTHICQKMLPLFTRVNSLVSILNNLCDSYNTDDEDEKDRSPDNGKGIVTM